MQAYASVIAAGATRVTITKSCACTARFDSAPLRSSWVSIRTISAGPSSSTRQCAASWLMRSSRGAAITEKPNGVRVTASCKKRLPDNTAPSAPLSGTFASRLIDYQHILALRGERGGEVDDRRGIAGPPQSTCRGAAHCHDPGAVACQQTAQAFSLIGHE